MFVSGWYHHHAELSLLGTGCSQLRVWSLGRHKGRRGEGTACSLSRQIWFNFFTILSRFDMIYIVKDEHDVTKDTVSSGDCWWVWPKFCWLSILILWINGY